MLYGLKNNLWNVTFVWNAKVSFLLSCGKIVHYCVTCQMLLNQGPLVLGVIFVFTGISAHLPCASHPFFAGSWDCSQVS